MFAYSECKLIKKVENDLNGKGKVGNNHVSKIENDLGRKEKD